KTAKHRQRLAIRALDSEHDLVKKTISFVAALPTGQAGVPREHITIGLLQTLKKTGELQCRVQVTDGEQRPIPNRKVYFGFFYPAGWREAQGTQISDAHGDVTLTCPLPPHSDDRFVFVAAGTDSPDRVRTGDMRLFKLGQ